MGCLTNEVAFHHFIDQNYDSNTMGLEDRRRMEILRSRAVRAGQALGIPPERTYGDTWQAAWKMIAHDRKEDALQEVKRARACLSQPSGSTRP